MNSLGYVYTKDSISSKCLGILIDGKMIYTADKRSNKLIPSIDKIQVEDKVKSFVTKLLKTEICI